MTTNKMENYYFIGIKGTGMAALACMLKDLGNNVSGSDLDKHFFTEDGLEKEIYQSILLILLISKTI